MLIYERKYQNNMEMFKVFIPIFQKARKTDHKWQVFMGLKWSARKSTILSYGKNRNSFVFNIQITLYEKFSFKAAWFKKHMWGEDAFYE